MVCGAFGASVRLGMCASAAAASPVERSAVLRVAPASALAVAASALVAPASAPAAAAALPAVAPLRLLGAFAGNGRRFRHGSQASERFSAGVVHCRLRRPGETLALGGVSGRFGLRNRPEVASGVCLR